MLDFFFSCTQDHCTTCCCRISIQETCNVHHQTRLEGREETEIICFYGKSQNECQNLTAARPESVLGPDLSLSGALCHFSVTSGLLSGETRSLGEQKGWVCGV